MVFPSLHSCLSRRSAIGVAVGFGIVVASGVLGPGAGAFAASVGVGSVYMVVSGATTEPLGHRQFCATYPGECARSQAPHWTGKQAVLSSWRWRELIAVNDYVNGTIAPTTDQELYQRAENWVYPIDRGDCEDYVLLKRRMLIDRGWSAGSLLITVVLDEDSNGHAVLSVHTDRGDVVLDNRDKRILLWGRTAYRYIKRQSRSDPQKWVAINDNRAREELRTGVTRP